MHTVTNSDTVGFGIISARFLPHLVDLKLALLLFFLLDSYRVFGNIVHYLPDLSPGFVIRELDRF